MSRTAILVALLAALALSASAALAADGGTPAKAAPAKAAPAKVTPAPAKPADTTTTVPVKPTATSQPVVKPKAPETPEEALGVVKKLVLAMKEGKWAWAVGLFLMLAVFVVNRVAGNKIPPAVLPWLAIGLGVAANFAFSLASGLIWLDALLNGISEGMAASGGWSALGKYLLNKGKPVASTPPVTDKPSA